MTASRLPDSPSEQSVNRAAGPGAYFAAKAAAHPDTATAPIPGRRGDHRREGEHKPFGIRVRMPEDDPLSAPHLLGPDWSSERWYRTAEERDRAFEAMQRQPAYYRIGDTPSVLLEKIDRDS